MLACFLVTQAASTHAQHTPGVDAAVAENTGASTTRPLPGITTDPGDDRVTKPLWELGLGGVFLNQLAYPGAGVQVDRVLVIPYAIYRGPIFRADESNVGLRAFRSAQIELDVGVAAAFGSDSSEVRIRDGLPKLGTLAEIGPQLRIRLGTVDTSRPLASHPLTLELPLRGVFDVSDSFAFRGFSFEPQLEWRTPLPGGFGLRATTSVVFGNRKLNDTFYGVAPAFATEERAAYAASAGLVSTRVGLSVGRALMPGLRLVGFVRVDHVGGAANVDSPLVQAETGWTAGLGFNWTFLQSSRPAAL